MKEPGSKIIHASGGLVENERGEVLFMFRRNKWDLPKGKTEAGESPWEGALREVKEETGIKLIEIKEFLLLTHHTYQENGQTILKETHWFRMKAAANQPMAPQLEEDITELRWINEAGFMEMAQNTYPNILEVLIAAGYNLSVNLFSS